MNYQFFSTIEADLAAVGAAADEFAGKVWARFKAPVVAAVAKVPTDQEHILDDILTKALAVAPEAVLKGDFSDAVASVLAQAETEELAWLKSFSAAEISALLAAQNAGAPASAA